MNETLITHAPILIIAIPLLTAFIIPLVDKVSKKGRNILTLCAVILTLILVLLLTQDVIESGMRIYTLGGEDAHLGLPSGYHVPVRITLAIDALSIFMVLISSLICFVGLLYSFSHIKEEGAGKFYTLFLLMFVGMLGMEMTGDLFNLFVFLEILSISSAALIAFHIRKGQPIEASIKYIIISSLAALFVLFATGLLYGEYNLLNMGAIASEISSQTGGLTLISQLAFVLLLSSFALKAGSAPMHMWIPDTYGEAPGAISMFLVAGTQASLYALLRVCFTIYNIAIDASIIGGILIILGLFSIFIGVTMALIQIDIKRLIGYAAVAEVGYIFLALGVGFFELAQGEISEYGIKALQGGIFHIFNDVLDIGLLFLVAGAIVYLTKETNLNKLGGLARSMKYSSFFFLIGLIAVAGLPPLNGFASKILIYESVYKVSPLLSIIAILASIFMLAIFVKIFYSVFMGPKLPSLSTITEAPRLMLASMAILSGIMIFFGLFPDYIVDTLVTPAVDSLVDNFSYITTVMGGT
jgi:multicomponent Na+:H+ antiporter subunit D